jgi:hypothetical protein
MQYRIADTYLRSPATQSDSDHAKRRMTYVPRVLQSLWNITNGVNNIFDQEIFSIRDMLTKNDALNIKQRDPLYTLVGMDGERGIFIRTSDHGDQMNQTVYALNPAFLGSLKPERVAENLYEWVNENFGTAEE